MKYLFKPEDEGDEELLRRLEADLDSNEELMEEEFYLDDEDEWDVEEVGDTPDEWYTECEDCGGNWYDCDCPFHDDDD